MSGFWQATSATTGPSAIAAPAGAAAAGTVIRVRAITAAAGASPGLLTITDSNGSTVIFQVTLTSPVALALSGLDIRGSVGGNLTIALPSGLGVSAQGDYVPIGYPYGLT